MTKGSKLYNCNWIKRNEYITDQLDIDTKCTQLNDLYSELGEIKVIVLGIGDNIKRTIVSEWNEIQSETIKLFNLKIEKIVRP